MSAAQPKTKKTTASKTKTTKAKTSAKAATHPPFADIIRACIADSGDRTGVSRPTIKKYIEEKYKMEVTASVTSNINRSIAYGAERGTFVLPKGPSGKVKLAPKRSSSDAAKENKPTKPTPVKKPAASKSAPAKAATKSAKKTTTAVKKTPAAKKTTPLVKKTTKPATAKKTSTKRAPAKKAMTGSAKAKPAAKTKSTPKKKTASAAAPASKRKSASSAKPASKAAPSSKPASPKK